jgi:DNA polymerase
MIRVPAHAGWMRRDCALASARHRSNSTCSPAMVKAVVTEETDFTGWRCRARALAAGGVPPEQVVWQVAGGDPDIFASQDAEMAAAAAAPALSISRRFIELAETVICHRDPERFALLYRMLWRMTKQGQPRLIDDLSDPLVARLTAMAAAVRHDTHKMKAFVRFREVADDSGPVFVAWFEPRHRVLERTAPFFVERFAGQRWSVLTPDASAHWDGKRLTMAAGADRTAAPDGDAMEDLWRTYYASIFNPARLNIAAMRGQMPRYYHANLPEAAIIPELARTAAARTATMLMAAPTEPRHSRRVAAGAGKRLGAADEEREKRAMESASATASLAGLRDEASGCRRCPLWQPATQTVFGEGPQTAHVMLVGEQPGDQEDLQGRPFVGPAGGVLDRALAEAGVDRQQLYVTNAVKHFKYLARGKRRMHQKPNAGEIEACRFWLAREIALVAPAAVVALGATAARGVLGRDVTISRVRGHWMRPAPSAPQVLVTVHPSYLLRLPDEVQKEAEYRRFVDDLRLIQAIGGVGAD